MNRETKIIDLHGTAADSIEVFSKTLPEMLKDKNLCIKGESEEIVHLSDLFSDDNFQKTLSTDRELHVTTLEIVRKLNDAF